MKNVICNVILVILDLQFELVKVMEHWDLLLEFAHLMSVYLTLSRNQQMGTRVNVVQKILLIKKYVPYPVIPVTVVLLFLLVPVGLMVSGAMSLDLVPLLPAH